MPAWKIMPLIWLGANFLLIVPIALVVPEGLTWSWYLGSVIVAFLIGVWYFARYESVFVDKTATAARP